MLKTTQSGYEGFLHDSLTSLEATRERLLATSVAAEWRYSPTSPPRDFDAAFDALLAAFAGAFFGPPRGGAYSAGACGTQNKKPF